MDKRRAKAVTGIFDTRLELEEAVKKMAQDKENYPSFRAIGKAAGISAGTASDIVRDRLKGEARDWVDMAGRRDTLNELWKIPDLSFLQEELDEV